MKTIIAGSRTIWSYLDIEEATWESRFEITEVVCGMAPGVDTVGEAWAMVNNIPCRFFRADWSKGLGAGFARNRDMGNYADALIAVWDGESKGTKQMIKYAEEKRLKIYVKIISNVSSSGLFVVM